MRAHRWDTEPRSGWRAESRRIMEEIVGLSTDIDPAYTLSVIDASYPFGERAMLPYAMWLDERRRIRVKLGLLDDPRRTERIRQGQKELVLP